VLATGDQHPDRARAEEGLPCGAEVLESAATTNEQELVRSRLDYCHEPGSPFIPRLFVGDRGASGHRAHPDATAASFDVVHRSVGGIERVRWGVLIQELDAEGRSDRDLGPTDDHGLA